MTKITKIKLVIQGEEISYKKEIDEITAIKIMNLCSQGTNVVEDTEQSDNPVISTITNKSRPHSPAEFIHKYGPKRNPDKILVLAFFLDEVRNQDRFTPNEIKKLFVEAGEVVPANFTRDFKWSISSSWVTSDPSKKDTYYVTTTGKNVVTQGFPKDLVKKSLRGRVLKGRKKFSKKLTK